MTEQTQDQVEPEPRPSLFDPPGETVHMAPATVVARRRGGTPFPVTLLLTLILAGAGFWAWTHPEQGREFGRKVFANTPAAEQGPPDPAEQIQAISTRLALLEKQPTNAADASADLTKKLDDLSGRVDALTTKQSELATQGEKTAELLSQKSVASAPAEAPPPPDSTPAQLAGLETQQQASDARVLADKVSAQSAAIEQSQTATKAAFDALDQRLAKLEQAAGQAPAADQADQKALLAAQAGDAASLAALDSRLGKLEQSAGQIHTADAADQKALSDAQAGDKQSLDALDARVAKLEQATGQAAGEVKDATRAAKIAAAQAALAVGQPLGDLPNAPPAVARFAKEAPPTEEALRAAFPQVAQTARAASQPASANRSFLDRMLARAQQSVVVRQGDHVLVGDPAAGVLAHAQDQVSAGDLKDAVATLGALQGPAATSVQAWMGQARALLDARDGLASMAAHS